MREIIKAFFICICFFSFICCGSNSGSNDKTGETIHANNIQDSHIVMDKSEVVVQSTKTKKNKKNLVVKEWNTNVIANTKYLDHITTYSSDGQKIEEQEYNTEGLKWRERYEYDANGNKIRELLYDGHNQLVSVKRFEYNEFGKKKMVYTYNANGKLVTIKNYEYIAQ